METAQDVVDGESSNGEADGRTCCVDDLGENRLEDMELSNFNALNPNDFVLTQFATKKTTFIYIGQVQNRIEDTDETT